VRYVQEADAQTAIAAMNNIEYEFLFLLIFAGFFVDQGFFFFVAEEF
jgi:hypothetical protein